MVYFYSVLSVLCHVYFSIAGDSALLSGVSVLVCLFVLPSLSVTVSVCDVSCSVTYLTQTHIHDSVMSFIHFYYNIVIKKNCNN